MKSVSIQKLDPRKGFSRVVQAVTEAIDRVRQSEMQLLASSLAFATVVSIVPLLAVSLSVFKAYGGFDKMLGEIERLVIQNLAGAAGVEVRRALRAAIERVHSGALGLGGMAGLVITSTKLFHDMDAAIHRVWGLRKGRPLLRRLLVYWAIMFAGPVGLAATLGLVGSIDIELVSAFPKRSLGLGLGWFALFAVCKWVPARVVDTRPALWSSIGGAVAFMAAQEVYSTLTKQILSYNKVYGSLASIPIFLLWILILWQICLGTVAFCAAWQMRRDAERQAGI